jgi:hypothetical protein
MYKFYPELTFDASIDHRHSDWSPDNPYSFRQWYHEDITGKDTLIVTVGDSWTFGDHLGCIDWDKASDDPIRLTQIYGRKLSEFMDADWVNLAKPGCSNYWMLEALNSVQHHFQRLKASYKRIIIIVTLTEDLREATYNRVIDVNTPYRKFWNTSNGIQDFLVKVETFLFDNLQNYFNSIPFVEFKVSRAFTDSWSTRPFLMDKTWCDVLQDKVQFNNYKKPVPFIGQMSINPLQEKFISTTEHKQEFLEIMENVGTRWQFLGMSDYNLKGSTCHPNPAGHLLWAEHIFNEIR